MDIRLILIAVLTILLILSLSGLGIMYIETRTFQPQNVALVIEPTPNPNLPSDLSIAEINVYFITEDYQLLKPETRHIPQPDSIVERVEMSLQELLEGPRSRDLLPTIPDGTTIRSVFWNEEDQLIAVNFSPELLKTKGMHALQEWSIIYSIVNTVAAQSSAYEVKVQILVDGKPPVNTLWDWTKPFEEQITFRYQD